MNTKEQSKRPRRRGGGKGPNTSTKLSHALSWALRHAGPDIGLTMIPAGWVPVQEIIESKHPRLKGTTLEALEEVVTTNDKQRFALSMRPGSDFGGDSLGENSKEILCVRANQGHSIKTIDPDLLLTKLSSEEVKNLACIVHGTNSEAWKCIADQGLSKMNRTHIHFATGLPEDGGVISGMRKSASVHIFIDSDACVRDGIEFYISENGVVLTDGVNGILPTKYFLKVTDANGVGIMTNHIEADS